MIVNERVFTDDYPPNRLLHRDAEQAQLSRAFEPAIKTTSAEDVLLSGPSGVGKTTLVTHVLGELRARTRVATHYVPLVDRPTDEAVLGELVAAHPHAGDPTGASIDTLRDQLRSATDERATIVVLDEADSLPERDLLDHLAGIPGLSTVAICHDPEEWLGRVDQAHQHRYSGDHHLRLGTYGVDELADILQRRAEQGLDHGAVERGELEQIANKVAGKARHGITALRVAAEIADDNHRLRIQPEDVEAAIAPALVEVREHNLGSLPYHHRVLYALVREAGEIRADALYERYDQIKQSVYAERTITPIKRRSRTTAMNKLAEYELVTFEGKLSGRVYQVCDERIESDVELSESMIS